MSQYREPDKVIQLLLDKKARYPGTEDHQVLAEVFHHYCKRMGVNCTCDVDQVLGRFCGSCEAMYEFAHILGVVEQIRLDLLGSINKVSHDYKYWDLKCGCDQFKTCVRHL